jgi:hypothetical protein
MLPQKMSPVRSIAAYINIATRDVRHKSVFCSVSCKIIDVVLSHVFWLAPCFLVINIAQATTVIAVTTDSSVYIGADSCAKPKGTICKIVIGNGVAVGMSGHLADAATHFNAATTIRGAIAHAGTLQAALDLTIAAIEPPLHRSLEWGFKNAIADYSTMYQGKLALALLFIGIENGIPKIIYLTWHTNNGDISRLPMRSFGANAFDCIGTFNAITSYIIKTPNWTTIAPEMRIVQALQIESDAEPREVAPPFTIVRITPDGRIKWVRYGVCRQKRNRKQQSEK